jgi:hypothetical protein
MTDAFIYDHVRTPRGRGKVDGALHEVTALNLATQALATLRERNGLDPSLVDDVVMGCVDPVGEAGGDIARVAAICAGYGNGVPGVQINRFCASGLDAVKCTGRGGPILVRNDNAMIPIFDFDIRYLGPLARIGRRAPARRVKGLSARLGVRERAQFFTAEARGKACHPDPLPASGAAELKEHSEASYELCQFQG